jgi:hypothetical protein
VVSASARDFPLARQKWRPKPPYRNDRNCSPTSKSDFAEIRASFSQPKLAVPNTVGEIGLHNEQDDWFIALGMDKNTIFKIAATLGENSGILCAVCH